MSMFDKYNEVGYVPNNLSAPSSCHFAPRIPGKPFEDINFAGELVGYYWYYGDTLKLEFIIDGEVIDDSGNYIKASDYFSDTTFSNKSVKFRLFDFRHEEIYSKEFTEVDTNVITIDIDQELSNSLERGTYYCSLELIDDLYPNVITLFEQGFCTLTIK